MFHRKFIAMVAACWILAAWQSEAHACSCKTYAVKDRVAQASQVFIARISSTSEMNIEDSPLGWRHQVRAGYVLLESLKGSPAPKWEIRSAVYNGGANCGVMLASGNVYVIFLDQGIETSGCHGTSVLFDWPLHDRKYLEEIRAALSILKQ